MTTQSKTQLWPEHLSYPDPVPVVEIFTAYGPKISVGLECPEGSSLTKQSFKDECDINVLMARYEKTGILPDNGLQPRYLDVTGYDFRTSMETLALARSAFAELPAYLRARFNNDPAQLLDFVHDEQNREEAIELGLLKPRPEWVDPTSGEILDSPAKIAPAASGEAPAATSTPTPK